MKDFIKQHQALIYSLFILIGLLIFFTTTEPIFFWIASFELIICSYQLYCIWKKA